MRENECLETNREQHQKNDTQKAIRKSYASTITAIKTCDGCVQEPRHTSTTPALVYLLGACEQSPKKEVLHARGYANERIDYGSYGRHPTGSS